MKKPSDDDLVLKAQKELPYATDAYEELMHRYQDRIFNVCNVTLKDYHLAEDATQNSMLRIFHYLKNFNNNSTFFTWIYRIAYNESLQIINKSKNNYTVQLENNEFITTPENIDFEIEVDQIFDKLDENEKELLTLKYILEFNDEDIAKLFKISLSACKMRLKRLKEKINFES